MHGRGCQVRRPHIEFGADRPSGLGEKFENCGRRSGLYAPTSPACELEQTGLRKTIPLIQTSGQALNHGTKQRKRGRSRYVFKRFGDTVGIGIVYGLRLEHLRHGNCTASVSCL